MTALATARPTVALVARLPWPRAAGILILIGGVLLATATALEIGTDVSTNTMYFVSTGAQIVAGILIARASLVAAK